ncbi:ABC transporter permease [Lactococcus termiticola]|uniref:Multidrug ABC transporter permease protein n=1 Tax=Lactococcus termiticola TaxID=2169526 RepID=A0A2R5HD34_9LACT|nr:ABC transporter permease [Lactococcus termiticola]GBG95987.1 multidrug ABC transporter permease protein [Lactococcus termiticola]
MNKLFSQRRKAYYAHNIKYLRYVFNDHFTIFLMILIAALAVQYVSFLQHGSLNLAGKIIAGVLVSLIALIPGRIASFLEPADKVFLLVKERLVQKHLYRRLLASLVIPGLVALALVLLATPLLKLSPVWAVLWFVLLLVLKALLYFLRLQQFQRAGVIDWEGLIKYEENRKTATLRFFALFTSVKGLKGHARRRRYLDFLLPKKTMRTYEYLYSRAFLRTGDYLGLTLRLLLLAVLVMAFLPAGSDILRIILVALLNYLLIFQLISIREAFDYQPLIELYPLKKKVKNVAVRALILKVFTAVTIIELILGAIFLDNRFWLIALLLINFVLMRFYVKFRLKK